MGELNDVLLTLASNLKVHEVIDIIVMDIPDSYGLFLIRVRSQNHSQYFSMDWSHIWLPHNGK